MRRSRARLATVGLMAPYQNTETSAASIASRNLMLGKLPRPRDSRDGTIYVEKRSCFFWGGSQASVEREPLGHPSGWARCRLAGRPGDARVRVRADRRFETPRRIRQATDQAATWRDACGSLPTSNACGCRTIPWKLPPRPACLPDLQRRYARRPSVRRHL